MRLHKYLRKKALPTPFCPGCGCGTILNLFVHALDELNFDMKKLVCVTGIGCSSWIPSPYLACDTLHTTHGRALAFATGVKLYRPDLRVVVIAGDGDILAIGGNHLIHAARRNLPITTILVNNSIYAMTGGQVAPTTPKGVRTTTTPYGNPEPPMDAASLVAAAGAKLVARYTTAHPFPLKRAIKAALKTDGFAFIEVLSQCPVSYGKLTGLRNPADQLRHFREHSVRVRSLQEARKYPDKITIGLFVGKTEDAE